MLGDTSGLLCYYSAAEPQHATARILFEAAGSVLTHSYVLAELVALAHARGVPRQRFLGFLRDLVQDPRVEVVWVGEGLHETAMQLLEARLDKSYSLCDAVSFVLMRERGIHEA